MIIKEDNTLWSVGSDYTSRQRDRDTSTFLSIDFYQVVPNISSVHFVYVEIIKPY